MPWNWTSFTAKLVNCTQRRITCERQSILFMNHIFILADKAIKKKNPMYQGSTSEFKFIF